MSKLILPKFYKPSLSVRETEAAICLIRDKFEDFLSKKMKLQRISAPMFLKKDTGLNDNLNGTEEPVSFKSEELHEDKIEIIHSLAKWKRYALKKYAFKLHEGLFTNMNAIRKTESLDNLHSLYVDQWDWEKIITKEERTEITLKKYVKSIFQIIKSVEQELWMKYPDAVYPLPNDISFVTTQELENRWPQMTPMEREDAIAKEQKCVFVMKIGDKLEKSKKKHDGRAPDYDDWSLNGDIIFWYEPLQVKLELSSMGIRVDSKSMHEQLKKSDVLERESLPFHQMLLNGELPYTIGGGIGQSRLCMLLLGKAHIGEVQASIWPDEMVAKCEEANISLL